MQPGQHRVRDAPDAHLKGGAVLDQRGDDLADPRLDRGLGLGLVLVQRPVGGDEGVDPVERNDVVAVRARHLLVDFRDDEPGAVRGRLGGVGGGAEGAQPVLVGRRELQERDIQLDGAR